MSYLQAGSPRRGYEDCPRQESSLAGGAACGSMVPEPSAATGEQPQTLRRQPATRVLLVAAGTMLGGSADAQRRPGLSESRPWLLAPPIVTNRKQSRIVAITGVTEGNELTLLPTEARTARPCRSTTSTPHRA